MDWTIWGALLAGALAMATGTAFLVVRALDTWRRFKRLRGQLAKSLQSLADTADRASAAAERVSDQGELEQSLARLRVTLARFNVLRAAVDEVDDTFRRVAFVPRR